MKKKVGDKVNKGDSLATIYANDREKLNIAKERFLKAYTISDKKVEKARLIKGVITE